MFHLLVHLLLQRIRKWKEMRALTGEWERLGFCPNCDVHMMGWAVFFDNGIGDIGRICPKCGYISPYFTDVLSGFMTHNEKPKLIEIVIGHGQWGLVDNSDEEVTRK